MAKRKVSIRPKLWQRSLCSNGTCLKVSSVFRRKCHECAVGKYQEVEPLGDFTRKRLLKLKSGSIDHSKYSTACIRSLTSGLMSRQRRTHPDREFEWTITDDIGVSSCRVDEVAYRIADTVSCLIDAPARMKNRDKRPFELDYVNPFDIRAEVERAMENYKNILESKEYLYQKTSVDGDMCITICHPMTGIRALFRYSESTRKAKYIRAKESGVTWLLDKTISNLDINQDSPTLFVGYGIGTIIYRIAGELVPDVRWELGSLKPGSSGVRRKLHLENPWRWASHCEVDGCEETWSWPTYDVTKYHSSSNIPGSGSLDGLEIRQI